MKLNNKILIIHVLIGCLLLLVTGYYTNVSVRKEKFQSIHEGFIDQLYQIDFAISSFLLGVEYDVENLIANKIVRNRDEQQFTNFLDADENTFEYHIGETEQAIINVFNNYRLTHPYANSVYMGRENGSFVRSHKRSRPTRYDPRERPWYKLALTNPGKVMRTAPYSSVTTSDVNIGTVKALINEQDQVYGVVGIDTTLRNLTDYISYIHVGENSDIVLLDDNGVVLTGRDENVWFKKYDEAGLEYLQAVMENARGYLSFEREDIKNYVFYYTSPALRWKICAIIPVQNIDREVSQFANRMLWMLGFSLLLLSGLTVVGVRKFIITPIKDLEQSTKHIIQTGNLDHRIETGTGDEIGQLATSFNEMVVSIRRAHDELELRVAQRTEELSKANALLKEEIAERKRAEQALQQAKDAAEKAQRVAETANRAKSTFLANMSHELRTPLNAILGFSQLLAHSPNLAPEQQENLEIISRSGEHLLTLINQVLDLSKIEAGRISLHETNFDLYRLLDDVVELFWLRAQSKNLQLLFERLPEVPQYVRTDKLKLRQVLLNLLNNALKFTTEGGIALRVANYELRNDQSEIRKVRFEIEDTGPGIAPEELATLFEAFTQTKAGKETTEGTGLGLTISQKFVHLMSGDINVASEVGRGTMFSFEIAAKIVDAAEVIRQQTRRRVIALESGQPRYRLLIVDDAFDNRKLLVSLLAPFNFELREAINGQEAIEIWEAWQPHLIWMDMRMPVMDGYEATKYIKSGIRNSKSEIQTVVIAVTASSFEEQRAEVLAAGCDDFLRKPFREVEIFELMHKHLGLRFVYAEDEGDKVKGERLKSEEVLTPEALAALPEELRIELQTGIESLDLSVVSSAIEQIRRQNAPFADALSELVKNYRFDLLQNWIEPGE